ncbi:succinylglutamate desuccinylase/aspartoacylase family protein [Phaeobacter sp. QD34_3]|uniref:succinylglutamate desuccinylase/aspartoacylase family protein n=1 Tax=unclassified Phaeobacter TaxID=2621772 RepID=UPI00237F48C7|nr:MULTISPECIES: succinylglutamate desuccinylase/aspartoacylase family protein [unclassified Phaeobacter]MDE4132621.1 succinylglutamate desuccinylase/aspartoacylase family protein [Phaeobacter sp. QD34_3]MDE4136257.1 succinylglutamate desuccinylase/aspartoacylase family protein [Phaeobacter sp. QD34_24]
MVSPVTSEVDFGAEGRQQGFLRVPHSVHRSAYGWIPVPVVCLCNGEGPTVLLMGGVHGDEYEGQIAISNLARSLAAEEIRGRVIFLPMANAPAAEAGLRTSPIDDGNLNRLFPGDPSGTPSQVIAHYIEEELLPLCDVMVDLHSGGSSLYYPPTLLRGQGWTQEEAALLKRLEAAFDLPYAWVFTGGGGPNSTARTAMGGANRKGVVSVMAELGGGGALDPEILKVTERGLRRILHGLGVLPGYEPDVQRGTRALHAQGSVYAYEAGIYVPLRDIGDTVQEGEAIGYIHRPDTPWAPPKEVTTPYSGLILAKRVPGPARRGDALVQVFRDAEP